MRYIHYFTAMLILVWTNCLVLFGLDISPAKEAALETIVNTVGVGGFVLYGIIHTWVLHKPAPPLPDDPAARR